MSQQPFLRQVEVEIGPLQEFQGGGDSRQSIYLFGDGSPETFRIKFNIQKHIISTASPTTISIYNLGPKMRSALQKSGIQIVVRAGWMNTGMVNVFKGSLLACVHQREGADIVSTLISLAGFGGTSKAVISRTFSGGMRLRDVLKTIAGEIEGITIDPKCIQVKDLTIGPQGQSFAGQPADWLDKLARVCNFSWWIDEGVFYALDDGDYYRGGDVLISSANGFLLRAEPMLASPMQMQAGVSIQALFNPHIRPGHIVQLESGLNPLLNGGYKIHTLSHNGDTHSTQWTTSTETWLVQ